MRGGRTGAAWSCGLAGPIREAVPLCRCLRAFRHDAPCADLSKDSKSKVRFQISNYTTTPCGAPTIQPPPNSVSETSTSNSAAIFPNPFSTRGEITASALQSRAGLNNVSPDIGALTNLAGKFLDIHARPRERAGDFADECRPGRCRRFPASSAGPALRGVSDRAESTTVKPRNFLERGQQRRFSSAGIQSAKFRQTRRRGGTCGLSSQLPPWPGHDTRTDSTIPVRSGRYEGITNRNLPGAW